MITQHDVRKALSYNRKTGILRWKVSPNNIIKIGDIAGSISKKDGYVRLSINGERHLAHRIIWLGVYGHFPKYGIDHKDKIRHHNWLSNLRDVPMGNNNRNRNVFKNNTSGVQGVTYCKTTKKWVAQITINSNQKNITYTDNFDEAVCHRLAAEQCLDWELHEENSTAYQYVKTKIQNDKLIINA